MAHDGPMTAAQVERLTAALAERYRLDEQVGAGGTATVYRAHDLRHGRDVAIKVLRPELATALGPERFQREITIAAGLNHPNILALLDSGEAGGFFYYAMPFVESETLRDRLARERQLSVEEAVRITRETAEALQYAHNEGVVHRDVKPANLLLHRGHAVVTDFGIATAVASVGGTRLTHTGVSIGTPMYMSPEQAAGDVPVDARSDVYSLACVLYEMLAGDPPFTGSTPQAILARKVSGDLPSLRVVRPTVPEAVEAVLERALATTPADRFRSVSEFAEALLEAEGATDGGRRPESLGSSARRFRIFAVPALLSAAALLAVWWTSTSSTEGELAADRLLVAQFTNDTSDPDLDDLGKIVADWFARDLQQIAGIDVIDPRVAVFSTPSGDEAGGNVTELARGLGSGTVVSGSYYRRGDSLYVAARLTETATGTLIRSLDPVATTLEDPLQGVERLGDEVTGAAAALFDPDFVPIREVTSNPNTYSAYREYVRGFELFSAGDLVGAVTSAYRSMALDSTFHLAAVAAMGFEINRGALAAGDSLVSRLERNADRLTPLERHIVEAYRLTLDGDRPGAYRAGLEAYRLSPTSSEMAIVTAPFASLANYPGTTIEMLTSVNRELGLLQSYTGYWDYLAQAYHLTGDHETGLDVARDLQARRPDYRQAYFMEARALVAMERTDEVLTLVEEYSALPVTVESPGQLMRRIARELQARGLSEHADEMRQRALEWFETVPGEAELGSTHREQYAIALLDAERFAEARVHFEDLAATEPAAPWHLGRLGVAAAGLGDSVEAMRIDEVMAGWEYPYSRGIPTLWRAMIAATLGEDDRAITLLQTSFAEGMAYNRSFRTDPPFQALLDREEFEELIRPKG